MGVHQNSFQDFHPVAGTTDLPLDEQHHLSDLERIAQTLAKQAGAPAETWPFYIQGAETLIRLSTRWTNGC